MGELRICPFCGGEPEMMFNQGGPSSKRGGGIYYYFYVECPYCGARSRAFSITTDNLDDFSNWRRAINSWNRRESDGGI